MKHCFIVTSAINTKFGVFSSEERLQQTITTLDSIKAHIPAAKIVVVEMAGISLSAEQEQVLVEHCDILLDFTEEESVKTIYNSTDTNWDVVKNGTEIMIFGSALKLLMQDGEFDGIDRIHKISGRYRMNSMFDPLIYEQENIASKIVLSKKRLSQFPIHLTSQREQYMSRLWSWPSSLLPSIVKFYDDAYADFTLTIRDKKYIDIEHLLCKWLPSNHIHELAVIGIEGSVGPIGKLVKD